MAKLPLLSRLQNDPFIRVIDVDDTSTMDEIAAAGAAPSVGYQTTHPGAGKALRIRRTSDDDNSPVLARGLTAKQAGLAPFDCVDIFVE